MWRAYLALVWLSHFQIFPINFLVGLLLPPTVLQSQASRAVDLPYSFSTAFASFTDSLSGCGFLPSVPNQVFLHWQKIAGFQGQPCFCNPTALTNWGIQQWNGSSPRQKGCRILLLLPKVQLIFMNKFFLICCLPLVNFQRPEVIVLDFFPQFYTCFMG